MSNPLARLLGDLENKKLEISEGAMQYPKSEPFEHGIQVGKYQGLQVALDLLVNILRDTEEKE